MPTPDYEAGRARVARSVRLRADICAEVAHARELLEQACLLLKRTGPTPLASTRCLWERNDK